MSAPTVAPTATLPVYYGRASFRALAPPAAAATAANNNNNDKDKEEKALPARVCPRPI